MINSGGIVSFKLPGTFGSVPITQGIGKRSEQPYCFDQIGKHLDGDQKGTPHSEQLVIEI